MRLIVAIMLIAVAGAAAAQSVSSRQAAAVLFEPGRQVVQVSSALSKAEQGTIKALVPLMEQQMQTPVRFYSSIAYAPDQGLVSEALQGAFNHHSPAAADRAARRACAAAKPRGAGPCRIAARVLPRGYQSRPLTLSEAATRAFDTTYRRLIRPKAFAISETTGAWGLGGTERAALNNCRRGGARDCRVVIRD